MPYKKGESGNLKGRPKGSKDKRTALRDLMQPHAPKLIEKVVSMALDGDSTAMRICIDRLIAPLSSDTPAVAINVETNKLGQAGEAVLRKAFDGQISPTVAREFMRALYTQTQLAEMDEVIARVEKLEAQHRDQLQR